MYLHLKVFNLHTEILLHVLINLVWLSLIEKGDWLWPNKVWDLEAQGTGNGNSVVPTGFKQTNLNKIKIPGNSKSLKLIGTFF